MCVSTPRSASVHSRPWGNHGKTVDAPRPTPARIGASKGASHRVDVEALHLVYLDLVPGHLRSIARSLGVCGLASGSDSGIATPQYWAGGRAPPYRCKSDGQLGCVRRCRFSPPYGSPQRASRLAANDALLYASMSGGMDPDDSAWLMPALSTPFTPVPPQTWVEVSHCPRWDARSKSTAALRTAGWSKMWFYVAPGSGFSATLSNY